MARQELEARIRALRAELTDLEDKLELLNKSEQLQQTPDHFPLLLEEYRRYGRQMILPGIGLPGQLKIKKARMLVIGAGGLGCPLLLYLAGAGIGHITIIDDDTVELSNLHRQVLHSQHRLGLSKVESAKQGIRSINPNVDVDIIEGRFNVSLLQQLKRDGRLVLSDFDLLADCTDNPQTRYTLSDLAVQHDLTLVSGGAVGLEGWVGVWNLPAPPLQSGSTTRAVATITGSGANEPARGPCLRCIYPQNNNSNSGSCEDDGILGTVVGTIGVLMASEALKLIVGLHDLKPSMTLFSPMSSPMFRTVKLRGRKTGCPGCSVTAASAATADVQTQGEPGPSCAIEEGRDDTRFSASQLQKVVESGRPFKIIDTRPETEFGICAIPGSINIPHTKILRDPSTLHTLLAEANDIYFVCRRGNESLLDARLMKELSKTYLKNHDLVIGDLRGGLQGWHRFNPNFPLY